MKETKPRSMIMVDSALYLNSVTVTLRDGTPVVLRPVRPDDQSRLETMLASCSSRTIYSRFHYVSKRMHELASQFCADDSRHKKVIVAAIESGDQTEIIGLGDLAADARYRSAEVAVLVTDRWHGKGLGGVLADHCIDVAQLWGPQEVVAVTTPDNRQVIAMARKRGFRIVCQWEDRTIVLSKRFRGQGNKPLGNVA